MPWRRPWSGAAGTARTPSTSRPIRTGTSGRSGSDTTRAVGGSAGRVTGRTKREVRDKLKALHAEVDVGIQSSATYTVEQTVADWLAAGFGGPSQTTQHP